MEQLQEKIINDVTNIIKTYTINDRACNHIIVISKESMQEIAKDLAIYINTLRQITPNIITYEEEVFDEDNRTDVRLTFHINNSDFKTLHSFIHPSTIVLLNLETFELKEVGDCTLYELLKDTDHESEIKHFIQQFAYYISKNVKNSYSENYTITDIFSDELCYFQSLEFKCEKEIYATAVGYTVAREALFKPIKDIVYIHGLDVLNLCFDNIDFIK